jgi:hypothetical protein
LWVRRRRRRRRRSGRECGLNIVGEEKEEEEWEGVG